MTENSADFYIDSISPQGFFSLCGKCAEETDSTRSYLVHGGVSECGEFIAKVVSFALKEGIYVQKFLNYYDSSRLDGAYFPDSDVYIFDANRNTVCASMPDCRQYMVDLGQCCDRKELFLNKALIKEAMEKENEYITKAVRFLSTVQSVKADTARLSCEAVNTDKVERFVSRFVKREFGAYSSHFGREYFRMLTSFTPNGIEFPQSTLVSMCPKLYCIDDKTDFISSLLISQIRENALICGFDVISLISPLKTEKSPEHIIVPELGLGVITSNECHKYKGDCFKRISSTRFLDSEKIKKHKTRIRFNITAEKELLNQAYYLIGKACESYEEYRKIYSRSVDKSRIEEIAISLKNEILSYISCT